MLIVRPPSLLTRALHRMTWDLQGDHRDVYLTFDDGPTPVVTPWVLDRLEEAGAKATFFCLGRNVDKHPELLQPDPGWRSSVGNHSYSHLKGFRSSVKRYMDDIEPGLKHDRFQIVPSALRPDPSRTGEGGAGAVRYYHVGCAEHRLQHLPGRRARASECDPKCEDPVPSSSSTTRTRPATTCTIALPRTLEFLKEKGYSMKSIPCNGLANGSSSMN